MLIRAAGARAVGPGLAGVRAVLPRLRNELHVLPSEQSESVLHARGRCRTAGLVRLIERNGLRLLGGEGR